MKYFISITSVAFSRVYQAVLLGAALTLTGCGGGGGSSSPTTTPTAQGVPPTTQATALTIAFTSSARSWTITDLGTLGELSSIATGINDAGQVVGATCSYSASSFHTCDAFTTDANGANMRKLFSIGNYNGLWITSNGTVYGNSDAGVFRTNANGAGGRISLGNTSSVMAGVNNAGRIISGSYLSGPDAVGSTDFSTVLPRSAGPLSASAINNVDQVVGNSFFEAGNTVLKFPFLTNSGATSATQLSYLGDNSMAVAINDSGVIIGLINNSTTRTGFYTSPNGAVVHFIGTAQVSAFPTAINNNGDIVGDGWLYSGGTFTDLNNLPAVVAGGWTVVTPTAINNSGQIVGTGSIGGALHAFLLTPQ